MPSYCCLNCSSLFLTERSRDDHIERVHIQNEVEHRCPKCFGLFKSAINLKKHFERYHPSTIIPAQIMATEDNFEDESIEDLSKGLYLLQNISYITIFLFGFIIIYRKICVALIEDEKQLYLKMVKYFYKNWKGIVLNVGITFFVCKKPFFNFFILEQTMEINRCTAENKLLFKQNQVLRRRLAGNCCLYRILTIFQLTIFKIAVLQRQLKERNEELCNTLKISHRLMREQGKDQ